MSSITLWNVIAEEKNWHIQQITLDDSIKSLDEISALLPSGAYTTFRTYHHNQVLSLVEHFFRLEETTRLAGKPVKIYPSSLRSALRAIIDQLSGGDFRFRITIDLERNPGVIYVSTELLKITPQSLYENGGAALTCRLERDNPKAKMTRQLETATNIRRQFADEPVDEIITLSGAGLILEGLSSNFFAVKNQTIWTAEDQVLSGTIRKVALDLAQKAGYEIIRQGIPFLDLAQIDEAFITSTSRSILPIVEIDHHPVGSGKPGPVTKKLIFDFNEMLEKELEII